MSLVPYLCTLQSIQPTLRRLHQAGIGAILDYAAESDVHSDKGADSLQGENYEVIVRTYNYESEKKCDAHVGIFMKALEAAKTAHTQGFAAIKVLLLLQLFSENSTCSARC
jgi:proline dehydrogenase